MDCREFRMRLARRRELSLSQERELQAHLAGCSLCASTWQEEEYALRVLRSIPIPTIQPPAHIRLTLQEKLHGRPWYRMHRRNVVAVASVLCIALIIILLPIDIVQGTVTRFSNLVSHERAQNGVAKPSGTDSPVTIRFAAPERDRRMYETFINEFQVQNPGIRVHFLSLETIRDKALSQTGPEHDNATEPVPDFDPVNPVMRETVTVADTAAPELLRPEDIANGYVYDLSPFMQADPSFARDDFYPAAYSDMSEDTKIYSLPHTLHIRVLRYNKDLFAERGVPLPHTTWTWQDWLSAAEKLANAPGDEPQSYGIVDPNGFITFFGTLAHTRSTLLTHPVDNKRLDNPEIAMVLDRVTFMARSGAIYNSLNHEQEANDLICEGRIGIWTSSLHDIHLSDTTSGSAPYPVLPVPMISSAPEGYIMSSRTAHPDEAWTWLSFLSHQERTKSAVPNALNGMPARRSLAQHSNVWANLDQEALVAAKVILERPATVLPSDFFRLYTPISRALEGVLSGTQSSSQALQGAQALLEQQPKVPIASTPHRVVVVTPVAEATPDGSMKLQHEVR